ncbi:hypothetical protein G5S34_09620 [Herbaspirillum frisingense]|uniref:hypothetical protein n=1 Tax=Herbaspirillum TaxID=963 RepID=UPI0009808F96|nr:MULTISPECIES: hypothetical protein [Herbaspirillum]ONN67458.1 hypothetical protein BTM36_06235 [Herbaspirillum sp. VT-16-41]QNB07004.1 hypothetical protein G5S34_09620 [Herbaspirillum frisingense]
MAIDTTLTSLGSLNSYGLPAESGASNPVKASDNPAAVAQAIELSTDASVIVSLGGAGAGSGQGQNALTYNAAGLFDAIVSAGSADNTSPDLTQNQASQSYYQGILASITTPPTTSGIYDGNGQFSGNSGLTSDLSSLLKSDPGLTSTIVGDLINQGIVGGLISTTA